jgi:fatty acid synthase subunit alpha
MCFSGASGHSQGSIFQGRHVLHQQCTQGTQGFSLTSLCGQQLFPVLMLEPSLVQGSIEGGEGQPTPMLSISGLLLKDLQAYISKMNKHLPKNLQLNVSLHVLSSSWAHPTPSYGLVTNLCKPVFGAHFLVVAIDSDCSTSLPHLDSLSNKFDRSSMH